MAAQRRWAEIASGRSGESNALNSYSVELAGGYHRASSGLQSASSIVFFQAEIVARGDVRSGPGHAVHYHLLIPRELLDHLVQILEVLLGVPLSQKTGTGWLGNHPGLIDILDRRAWIWSSRPM